MTAVRYLRTHQIMFGLTINLFWMSKHWRNIGWTVYVMLFCSHILYHNSGTVCSILMGFSAWYSSEIVVYNVNANLVHTIFEFRLILLDRITYFEGKKRVPPFISGRIHSAYTCMHTTHCQLYGVVIVSMNLERADENDGFKMTAL